MIHLPQHFSSSLEIKLAIELTQQKSWSCFDVDRVRRGCARVRLSSELEERELDMAATPRRKENHSHERKEDYPAAPLRRFTPPRLHSDNLDFSSSPLNFQEDFCH